MQDAVVRVASQSAFRLWFYVMVSITNDATEINQIKHKSY